MLTWACGEQGARALNSSNEPCADKVALARNTSEPVAGAWNCMDAIMKAELADVGATSDDGITHIPDPRKHMDTVKFVGHRSLYNDSYEKWYLMYRVDGNYGGQHIVGYTEIRLDPILRLVRYEDTLYCKPLGSIDCTGLPA